MDVEELDAMRLSCPSCKATAMWVFTGCAASYCDAWGCEACSWGCDNGLVDDGSSLCLAAARAEEAAKLELEKPRG